MLRIATAAVLLPLMWAMINHAPPVAFIAFMTLVISLGCWEAYRMLGRRWARPFTWLGIATVWAVIWSCAGLEPAFGVTLPLVTLTILALIVAMWRRDTPEEMLATCLATVFPVLFIGLTLGHVVGLRVMPGDIGQGALMFLFICVIFADIAAFYVGTMIGRNRMAPRLSPKKSWEGAVGGILASVGGALLAQRWCHPSLSLDHAVALGAVLGLAAILGDLSESLLKRAVGTKDSSSLVPGHGGVLDRTDSLLFSAPILYYHHLLFLA